ncbi:MAG TPA: extradiol dioxygenase [Candidatus Binatia bacterium]|nr:extradiol dioxygenase [Candidatus Binatia bacterium]
MLVGVHTVVRSANPDADRAFLRDVLGLAGIDAGGGYHIFGLPPAELSVHEAEGGAGTDLFLMCADVAGFVAAMRERDIPCPEPNDVGWGVLTQITLPGGARVAVYEPRHERPAAKRKARSSRRRKPKVRARRPARGARKRRRRSARR